MTLLKKGLIKKVISMLITACLMIGIANIPAYAYTAVGPVEYSQEYNLQTEYVTPAQAVKKSTAKKTTAKPATKKATKKATSKKKVSLTKKIVKKYTKKGLTVLKTLAKKLKLKLSTVFNQFVKMGVTKAHMKKASSLLLKLMKKGENFVCCASLAVAKYLGIKINLAALRNLASDISTDVNDFISSNKNGFVGTVYELKTLHKSGNKYADEYSITLKNFMTGLKKGQKALVVVDCYNKKGKDVGAHEIMIKREKNGRYAVYDILINNGNKISYTAKEFEKFMNGKKAKGKTDSGKTITKNVFLDSDAGNIKYKFINDGVLDIVTNSKSISKAGEAWYGVREGYNSANKAIYLINKLLKKKNVNSLAKKWLKAASSVIKKCMNNYTALYFNTKKDILNSAYNTIKIIAKNNASIDCLKKFSSNIFSSLKKILN